MKYLIITTLMAFPSFAETVENKPLRYYRPNRLAVVIGAAPNAINMDIVGDNITYKLGHKAVLGLSYERKLDHRQFVGIEALSNGTFLFRAGEEF